MREYQTRKMELKTKMFIHICEWFHKNKVLLFSLSMISWENSQSTGIALYMMKENASFGRGLHLGYYFDVKKPAIYTNSNTVISVPVVSSSKR